MKQKFTADREKLTKILYAQGKTLAQVSREIGYDSGYLSTSSGRDKQLSQIAMNYLEREYGITADMIAPTEETKVENCTPQNPQNYVMLDADAVQAQYETLKNIENNTRLIGNLLMQILEEIHNGK